MSVGISKPVNPAHIPEHLLRVVRKGDRTTEADGIAFPTLPISGFGVWIEAAVQSPGFGQQTVGFLLMVLGLIAVMLRTLHDFGDADFAFFGMVFRVPATPRGGFGLCHRPHQSLS